MAILTEEDRLSYRIVFLVAIVALLAVPVAAVRIFAAMVIMCYLPAAPFAARAGTGLPASLALIVGISPLMIVVPVMVVVLTGLPFMTAVWAIVGIAMAQFLVYGTQRALVPAPDEKRLLIAMGVILLVAMVLSLSLPVTNSWWRIREDSWFHAAVYNRIDNHGMPVADPYFSPIRLQYMYFYHIVLLTVSTLTGLGPFGAMIFANMMALASCVFGVNYLVGFFARSTGARTLAVSLCVFGMNGLFYLFFPIRIARAFLGETSGVEILRHFFTLSPPGYETASRLLSIEGNQFLFLDKFMLGTALSLTLGLTCIVLGLIVSMRSGRWNWILTYFYVATLCGIMFLHLIIGITVVAATAGLMGVLAITGPRGKGGPGNLTITRQAVFTAIAVAITFPYIMSVLPRDSAERSVRFALQWRQFVGVAACVLAVAIPALWYPLRGLRLVRYQRQRTAGGGLGPAGTIAVWAAVVTVMALVIDLPTTNETKFAFPLHIALAALAAGTLDRWLSTGAGKRGRYAAIVFVLLCTVPVNLIYFGCAFADRTQFKVSPSEQAFYQWIEKSTDEDALFLEADDITRIPVLAARDLYWGTEVYARNWNYPDREMDPRRALRDAVFAGDGPDDSLLAHAALLDRPMYVVLRDIHADGGERFKMLADNPHLDGKYMTESIAVFKVSFNPGGY